MKENNRTSNSLKNSFSSLLSNIVAIIVGFIAQALFLKILNTEYLGLNGLFTNVLTMLSFFELGIGNAIVFYMYKPLAENNVEKIKQLMNFYKKSYRIIALIVFSIGMLLLPFIKYLVNDVNIDINIYIVYFLFLLSTVVSYLMVYKRNMLYADQKNYYINIIHCFYLVLLNISQLIFLAITKNYYLYLIIKICCQILENVVITILVNNLYPYINESNNLKLDKETEKNIFQKVKALIFHKVGYIIINGTDNIIISKFFGLVAVGLYSNYYLIINSVFTMFSQAITSLTASVGNLLVNCDSTKSFNIFKKIRFINFIVSTFCATCVLCLIQPFITIWIGKEYLLDKIILFVLVFNLFQKLQRCTYMTFKDSAGIWEEDRFVPIIESLLNIIFSILLLKIFGLAGVFLGTIVSGLALWCYSYPKFVYKKIFSRSYFEYACETLNYIFIFCIIVFITYISTNLYLFSNSFVQLIFNGCLCLIIPFVLISIIFRKHEEYKYFLELIKKILFKIMNKSKSIKRQK